VKASQNALEIPARQQRLLARWLRVWETPSLSDRLRVEFSPRLRRSFGRCYQRERLIRLTPSLLSNQSHLLTEILCHEAAHAAVYELYGPRCKPHGVEWQEMMRMAGYEPRVRIPVAVRSAEHPQGRSGKPLYIHRCPVCRKARAAVRPMRRWRCQHCRRDGRSGRLVILRSASQRRGASSTR